MSSDRPCRKRWRACSSSSGELGAGETFDGTRAPVCPEPPWTWDAARRAQVFVRCALERRGLELVGARRPCRGSAARGRPVDLSRCRGGQLALWPSCTPLGRGVLALEPWELRRARAADQCAPRALGLFPPQWCAGALERRPSVVRVTLEGLELEAAAG